MKVIEIPEHLVPLLDEMLYEMTEQRLEVCLVPDHNGNEYKMIRVACNRNPDWYREFCQRYPCTRRKKRTKRKDYTRINRKRTLKILEHMIRKRTSKSIYAEDLLQIAKDRYELYEQYKEEFEFKPWNNQF